MTELCFRYGEPIHPLPRRVIERGTLKQVSIELRPPSFKALRLEASASNLPRPYPSITVSLGETVKYLNAQLATAVTPVPEAQLPAYRVWKINPYDEWNSIEISSSMLKSSYGIIFNDSEKTLEEEGLQSDDCFVVEFKQGESWIENLDPVIPSPPSTVAGRPTLAAPLFNSSEGFFNRMNINRTNKSNTTASTSVTKIDDRSDSLLPYWKTQASQKVIKAIDPGILGLGNMLVLRFFLPSVH